MKTLFKIFVIGLACISNQAFTQDSKPELGTDFNKYVKEMDAYYETHDKESSGYEHYMRFRFSMASKVGREGIIKNFSALNQVEYDKMKPQNAANARTQATHGLWQDMGPHDAYSSDSYSGAALARLNCVAFHPTDINTLWVGTPAGGLWKTTNHGGTWACISNDFASLGISDVVVDQANPNIIYILTGDGDGGATSSIGVMKTIDGGLTWKETGLKYNVNEPVFGFALRMHPTEHNILLAATSNGIKKTVDWGDHWTTMNTGIKFWDIEFKPGTPTIIYAASNQGIMKSINTGDVFSFANTNFPTDPASPTLPKTWSRLSLAISPSAPNNVYVLCGGVPAAGIFSGMYKSTNSADSWALMSNTPNVFGAGSDGGGSGGEANGQPYYACALDVDPTNDARLFVGGINCWKSDHNGSTGTWSRETNWLRIAASVDPYVHADFHALKFRGSRLYACTDGGIYYTDDYGNSWSDISSGIGATQFYNIDIDANGYIGGTQDNGANEGTFGNLQMHNIGGGDSFGAVWHASNHGIKFLTTQHEIIRRQVDSFGNGVNLSINTGSGPQQFWYCTLKNATNNDGILWGIQNYNTLIRGNQTDFGGPWDWSWHNTNNISQATSILKGYSQGVDNPGIMYAAHEDKLLKSTNIYQLPGATWSVLSGLEPGLYYEDILTDPTNSQNVWVVCGAYQTGKKVYKSTNGGGIWINISGTLPNVPINVIALVPGGGEKLYIGTSIGVFYRSGVMTDWIYFSNGMPNVGVQDIKLSATHVVAGTFGRGIWRSELYSSCPPSLSLTPANETISIFSQGTQVHSAGVSLLSSRQYGGSVGTNIYYNATQFVELKQGFEIKKDAYMEVKNKGCPD